MGVSVMFNQEDHSTHELGRDPKAWVLHLDCYAMTVALSEMRVEGSENGYFTPLNHMRSSM